MLRKRIGKEAYFSAIDVMLRDFAHTPITTERLKAYFEAASQRDLTDFFDFWVYQGLIPSVQATWTIQKKVVSGTITSDIPFGSFEIPVVVSDDKRSETVWAKVENGTASFEAPGTWKKPKVQLDPTHATLTRKRSMKRAD